MFTHESTQSINGDIVKSSWSSIYILSQTLIYLHSHADFVTQKRAMPALKLWYNNW